MVDLYSRDKKLAAKLGRVKNSPDITDASRNLILGYYGKLRNKQTDETLSAGRKQKWLDILFNLSRWLKGIETEWADLDAEKLSYLKDRIDGAVVESSGKKFSPITRQNYRHFLKMFIRDALKREDLASQIRIGHVSNRVTRDVVLTEEEALKIVENCEDIQTRLIVFLLWETGFRVGELLHLRRRHIKGVKNGALITCPIEGKTKDARTIKIVQAAPLLVNWLNVHPAKEQDALLFFLRTPGERLPYPALCKRIRRYAKRAGITKRANPHAFRHARATFLNAEQRWTPARMRQQFGWSASSRMLDVYSHSSEADIHAATDELNGLTEADKKDSRGKPRVCAKCGKVNEYYCDYCEACSYPLTLEAALEADEKEKQKLTALEKQIGELKEVLMLSLLERKLDQPEVQAALKKYKEAEK
jgi:integrase/recombinase XerD